MGVDDEGVGVRTSRQPWIASRCGSNAFLIQPAGEGLENIGCGNQPLGVPGGATQADFPDIRFRGGKNDGILIDESEMPI
jgi:hypothetical protein